jgi:DNA cross-link repair 1C protein
MNFAKGILETRTQTFVHLQKILKPIPLETPSIIELSPGNELRVTLFDANHCIGAVMFLIEGDGKAILYTGDLRSETWLVNSLVQNPFLLPYATGVKTLDTVYLDTTFATKAQPYRKFPSKADGISELLSKVKEYPNNTKFYFMSWTFGYENVWMALSAFLGSKIHLDKYRWRLYRSLQGKESSLNAREAAYLCGHTLGNHEQTGCLTRDSNVRIHSCERGGGCAYMDCHGDQEAVYIMPVVSRREDGTEIREIGVGGGKGDLNTVQEVEIQNEASAENLIGLCNSKIEDEETLQNVIDLITKSYQSREGRLILETHLEKLDVSLNEEDIKLDNLIAELVHISEQESHHEPESSKQSRKTVTFPYSRHSSYSELCEFVAAFKPLDVYPCTVDEINWTSEMSMRSLFGYFCSGSVFRHDEEMYAKQQSSFPASLATSVTQSTEVPTSPLRLESQDRSQYNTCQEGPQQIYQSEDEEEIILLPPGSEVSLKREPDESISPPRKKSNKFSSKHDVTTEKSRRQWANEASLGLHPECEDWHEFGGLACVKSADESFEL